MSNIKYLKLRFPEFTGEWEVRKLGELIKVNMCKRIFSNQTASIGEVHFIKLELWEIKQIAIFLGSYLKNIKTNIIILEKVKY